MNILFVITELNEGGAENALGKLASGVAGKGHDVQVVCLYGDNGDVASRLRSSGIAVGCLRLHSVWRLIRILELRPIIDRFRPDLIHAWLFHANFLVRLVAPRDIPLLCSLRVVEPRRLHICLDRGTRARVTRYICVSEDVAKFAVHHLRVRDARCDVIGNGVDLDEFAKSRDAERSFDKLCGLTVARISRQKGLDILIRALAELPSDIAWQWQFVGEVAEPGYFAELKALTEQTQISERIVWNGFVVRDRIVDHYAAANLFALPSRWEGQANVILEAMAAGLPVLTSRTDGIKDIVGNDPTCMTIVDPNNADSWTKALIEFWENTERSEAQIASALNRVRTRTWNRGIDEHLAVYERVLSDRKRAG